LIRPHVSQLQQVDHGSVAAAELARFHLSLGDVLDFSVNFNSRGPAPSVLHAIDGTDWTRYPGDAEPRLREGLAQRNGVRAEQIALGNGSVELLWLIDIAILEPHDRVIVAGPTLGEYARATRSMQAEVREVQTVRNLPPARVG